MSNLNFDLQLGASALHLSIAYNNNDLIQDLVDAGANICQRAIGKYYDYKTYYCNVVFLKNMLYFYYYKKNVHLA